MEELAHVKVKRTGDYPDDFYDSMLMNDNAKPDYLLLKKTQPYWITILHNGFRNLDDWGMALSAQFNSQVIIVAAQSTAGYYAFSLYESGKLIRGIEYCYGEDFEPVNKGEKFSFEGEEPGTRVEDDEVSEYIFDYDSIISYADHFGLNLNDDFEASGWTIMKKDKPWWKFYFFNLNT
ncbi:MAG: hypothetical protein ACJ75J_06425 [Cytophagaceae bacterium]